MKVFLDTNIISRVVDGGWKKRSSDKEIVSTILSNPKVTKMVSKKIEQEILATSNETKKESLLAELHKLDFVSARSSLSYSGDFSRWNHTQDSVLTKLREIFKNESPRAEPTNDADHIYEAFLAQCEAFLTLDGNIIDVYENRKSEVKMLIGEMKILKPEDAPTQYPTWFG